MKALGLWAAVILAAACGSTAPAPATSACEQAFLSAAGVGSNADSVSDLYPAVRACIDVDQWTAGYDAVDGAGFSGTGREVLTNVCQAPEVASEPLCDQVQ